MLGISKSSPAEKPAAVTPKPAAAPASAAAPARPAPAALFAAEPEQPASIPSPQTSAEVSCIGSGMTIVGKINSDGAVNIYGRMEGELQAPTVTISSTAHFEGNLIAEDLTVRGRVKGTIRSSRVKLDSTAVVEGDIYHRSLSIEENALFEGSSRRQGSGAEVDGPSLQPPSPQPLFPPQTSAAFEPKSASVFQSSSSSAFPAQTSPTEVKRMFEGATHGDERPGSSI